MRPSAVRSWLLSCLGGCASVVEPVVTRPGVEGPEMITIFGGYDGVIQIDAFDLDRTEVTAAAYASCVRAGECVDGRTATVLRERPTTFMRDGHAVRTRVDHEAVASASSCNAEDAARGHHPINCISANEARMYCAWAGKRLPTDLEWKWAAQGRDWQRTYPWGSREPSCARAVVSDFRRYPRDQRGDVVNSSLIRAGCSTDRTWPVGSKPRGASRDGVLDMVGNVAEWTTSCVMRSGYALVGGDISDPRRSPALTVSMRSTAAASLRGENIGFRCARDIPRER